MAQMDLATLLTQVGDSAPGKSTAAIVRAANMALRRLYQVVGPTVRLTLTTTAPYETGTVAIAKGATAITLAVGTWAAGTDGQLVQCEGEATWYGFTRVTTGTGTLGSGFAGTTLTAGTHTIAYANYDLPTTLSSVFNIWRDSRTRLHRVNDEEYTRYMDGPQEPGQPLGYAIIKGTHASNSAIRIQLLPFPDAVYSFTVSGRARPTLFPNSTPSSEYSGLPEDYDDALIAGTLCYVMDQIDKQDRSAWWFSYWQKALNDAEATQNEGYDGQYAEVGARRVTLWQSDVAAGP